jgi:hypothetical protein
MKDALFCSYISTIVVSALLLFLITGCGMTYWAFPPGKTQADFKVDELRCQSALRNLAVWNLESCLANSGYRQISREEYAQIQVRAKQALEAALKPMDIAAYDVRTHEIFVGKSEPFLEKKPDGSFTSRAAVSVEGLVSKTPCSGQAELVKATATGKGSFGSATLLCKDGRAIQAVFTYESARSGYGIGSDGDGNQYRFVFGDLNLDPGELEKKFQEQVKNKQEL